MPRPFTGARRASIFQSHNRFNPFISLAAIMSVCVCASFTRGQTIHFTAVPPGYDGSSIELSTGFAGAFGVDPGNDRIIFAAIGGFGAMSLARINLQTGEVVVVADGPFGAIGGIAPLSKREIVVTENAGAAGGPPDETILMLKDFNPRDGDFNDPGETRELIAPILGPTSENWSGSQARLVPKRRHSNIKAGSVMIQTADGYGAAELLVLEDPGRRARFSNGGVPFFSGFDYNGGFDIDSRGRIMMGTLTDSFTGEVFALADLNGNRQIDPGESNLLVSGESGLSDLVVDGEDDVLFAGFDANFFGAIRTFRVPADPLAGTVAPADFASTDAGFLSAIIINSKRRSFEPGEGPFGARLVMSGFTGSFETATNILVLTPSDEGILAQAGFADEPWPSDHH